MRPISGFKKAVGRHLINALSVAKPDIHEMWDDNRVSAVDVMRVVDCPEPGVHTYATIGLCESPLRHEGKEIHTRVELLGACGAVYSDMDKVLATAAFCVINSGWSCAPGVIFPGVMEMYGLSITMSDIYFTYPYLWEERLSSTSIEGNTVAWLLAVPIAKTETEYARKFGAAKLEKRFVHKDINIFDYNRTPVA